MPRPYPSSSEMICIARTFGAPETVPAGKVARRRAKPSRPGESSPAPPEARGVTRGYVRRPALLGGEAALDRAVARGDRAGDRVQASPAALELHVRLRGGADEREIAELEQEEARAR